MMKKLPVILVLAAIGVALGCPSVVAQFGLPCSECGPGSHWVDFCTAGIDSISNTSALVGIDFNLDCQVDQTLIMSSCGLLYVQRNQPVGHSMGTEILRMCYQSGGIILRGGAGQHAGPGPLQASLGSVDEFPLDPDSADSFFDVFFEVDLGGGQFLYNQSPMKIKSKINCVPPQAGYLKPTGCVGLYTSPISGQGVHVANLVEARHDVNPPPIPTLSQWGLIIFSLLLFGTVVWYLRRRKLAPASIGLFLLVFSLSFYISSTL